MHRFFNTTLKRFFSPSTTSSLEASASSFPEYLSAVSFIKQQNWSMAELELIRCSEIICKTDLSSGPVHNFILESLAKCQKNQQKVLSCEKTLEEILKNLKSPSFCRIHLSLAKLFLVTNPLKAVDLCRSLESLPGFADLPIEAVCEVLYLFGTALILEGQFDEASKKLAWVAGFSMKNHRGITEDDSKSLPGLNKNTVLKDDFFESFEKTSGHLKLGEVLHNLAIATWLDSRELTSSYQVNKSMKSSKSPPSEANFSQSINLLQRSIQELESFPMIYDLQVDLNLSPDFPGKVLTNIGEIYLEQANQNKAVEWIKAALKFFEANDPKNTSKALLLLGHVLSFNKNALHAEGIFRNVSEQVKNKNDFSEVFLLEQFSKLLKNFKKREKEAQEMQEKALEIRKNLPAWKENAYYLILPEWSI